MSQQPDIDEMEVKAEMVATALRLNTLYLQRDNHVLKALTDSSSRMEAGKRLQTVQNCFQALRNKSKASLDSQKQRFHISRSFSSDTCQGNRQNKECRAETAYKSAKREKRSSF